MWFGLGTTKIWLRFLFKVAISLCGLVWFGNGVGRSTWNGIRGKLAEKVLRVLVMGLQLVTTTGTGAGTREMSFAT